MWSHPYNINILVAALIQHAVSVFSWTDDSRILLSCAHNICPWRERKRWLKVIHALPLVGTGLCCASWKHQQKLRNPKSLRFSAGRVPWFGTTRIFTFAQAKLWSNPLSQERSRDASRPTSEGLCQGFLCSLLWVLPHLPIHPGGT